MLSVIEIKRHIKFIRAHIFWYRLPVQYADNDFHVTLHEKIIIWNSFCVADGLNWRAEKRNASSQTKQRISSSTNEICISLTDQLPIFSSLSLHFSCKFNRWHHLYERWAKAARTGITMLWVRRAPEEAFTLVSTRPTTAFDEPLKMIDDRLWFYFHTRKNVLRFENSCLTFNNRQNYCPIKAYAKRSSLLYIPNGAEQLHMSHALEQREWKKRAVNSIIIIYLMWQVRVYVLLSTVGRTKILW